ncbi:MAG: hypothetical protein NTW17_02200 [Candidatus Pacearchaeota archaeon]|nr:hypothetical protein [Candidatus Pacearchaeota archaeon]
MTDADRKTEAIKKLELMLNDSEGFLPICSVKECGKIKVSLDGEDVWISRSDNSSLYDRVIKHYINSPDLTKGGLTHTVCPEDGRRLYPEFWRD